MKCDVCTKTKGETNRWLMAWVDGGHVVIANSEQTPPDAEYFDLCGQDCAIKKASVLVGKIQ